MDRWTLSHPFRRRGMVLGLLLLLLAEPLLVIAAEPPLVMGIFPRRNAQLTNRLFSPMVDYLSRQLGREVRLELSKDFGSFWDGVVKQRYDIVHFNQYHYVKSHREQGYEVILRNKELGEATIAGSLLVRKDSRIERVDDLRGRKVIFGGGKRAMQSYIVARYLLQQGGLAQGDYQELFSRNPPNAIFAAFVGEADAAGTGDKVLELEVVRRSIDSSKMRFLARGEQLPHLPWAVKGSLPDAMKGQIQSLLGTLDSSEEGRNILSQARLDALVATRDSDYDEHRKIIAEVLDEHY